MKRNQKKLKRLHDQIKSFFLKKKKKTRTLSVPLEIYKVKRNIFQ